MFKSLIFFVGLYLTTFTNALFDDPDYIRKITNTIELLDTFMEAQYLTAVVLYRNDNRSQTIEPIFNKFAENRHHFFRFIAVDCDSIESDINQESTPACHESFRGSLPQVLFLEPQIDQLNTQTNRTVEPIQHRFEGHFTLDEFNDFAKDLMPNFSKRLVSIEQLN